ncbi:MAG TPA: hypothetical protein VMI54_16485 [Polyangiaceae bacterium]|nr:hypothetical protein [Polyangiaceae bacterium]
MRVSRILPALSLVLVSTPAFAYRPFDGTDGSVAEYGTFELEAGMLGYLRQGAATYSTPSQILNYGASGASSSSSSSTSSCRRSAHPVLASGSSTTARS